MKSKSARTVRVTNPIQASDVDVMAATKQVGAFAAGAVAGGFVISPLIERIDERIEDERKRGAVKLAAAVGVLTGLSLVASQAKTSSKNTPLVASAVTGSVSGLIASGIEDLRGRGVIMVEEVQETASASDAPQSGQSGTVLVDQRRRGMSGTVLLPGNTQQRAMAGIGGEFAEYH